MSPEITLFINNYISDNYYIKDSDLYEMRSNRLILPKVLEGELNTIFALGVDLNHLITYKWLYFNGMTEISKYWNIFKPTSINPIINQGGWFSCSGSTDLNMIMNIRYSG